VFRNEEVPDPTVGAGDVLIKVEAVSIEGGDTLNRLGARRAGARVFATASSDDKLERLKEIGLDEGINYVRKRLRGEVPSTERRPRRRCHCRLRGRGSPRAHTLIAGHLEAMARRKLRVILDRAFPLPEAAAAHAYIESRQSFGRVLLVP
jgi:NADPH2:quinone reductase